jgi:hypothetical protein
MKISVTVSKWELTQRPHQGKDAELGEGEEGREEHKEPFPARYMVGTTSSSSLMFAKGLKLCVH